MSIAPAKEGDERDAKLLRKKWEGLGPGFLFVKSVANKAHLNCKWRSFAELLIFSCVCVNSFYCDQQDFSDICPLLNKWVVFQSKRSEKHLAFDRHMTPPPPKFFFLNYCYPWYRAVLHFRAGWLVYRLVRCLEMAGLGKFWKKP